jgi:hypothetical protein
MIREAVTTFLDAVLDHAELPDSLWSKARLLKRLLPPSEAAQTQPLARKSGDAMPDDAGAVSSRQFTETVAMDRLKALELQRILSTMNAEVSFADDQDGDDDNKREAQIATIRANEVIIENGECQSCEKRQWSTCWLYAISDNFINRCFCYVLTRFTFRAFLALLFVALKKEMSKWQQRAHLISFEDMPLSFQKDENKILVDKRFEDGTQTNAIKDAVKSMFNNAARRFSVKSNASVSKAVIAAARSVAPSAFSDHMVAERSK